MRCVRIRSSGRVKTSQQCRLDVTRKLVAACVWLQRVFVGMRQREGVLCKSPYSGGSAYVPIVAVPKFTEVARGASSSGIYCGRFTWARIDARDVTDGSTPGWLPGIDDTATSWSRARNHRKKRVPRGTRLWGRPDLIKHMSHNFTIKAWADVGCLPHHNPQGLYELLLGICFENVSGGAGSKAVSKHL